MPITYRGYVIGATSERRTGAEWAGYVQVAEKYRHSIGLCDTMAEALDKARQRVDGLLAGTITA
jgi:hypothetical protein